jgi:hypothetical protein
LLTIRNTQLLQHPQPGLLHDLLGDRPVADVDHGQAQHRPMQRLHQPDERGLVAATKRLEEFTFLCGEDRRGTAKG